MINDYCLTEQLTLEALLVLILWGSQTFGVRSVQVPTAGKEQPPCALLEFPDNVGTAGDWKEAPHPPPQPQKNMSSHLPQRQWVP